MRVPMAIVSISLISSSNSHPGYMTQDTTANGPGAQVPFRPVSFSFLAPLGGRAASAQLPAS